jgi:hypothetical protein
VGNDGFASVLDTGLDFTTEEFTPSERENLIRWYMETHGEGDMELNQFAELLMDYSPGALKSFRRTAIELAQPDATGDGLPQVFYNLLYLHLYTVLLREKETLYEVISCRNLGLSKAEVLDTIGTSFIMAGPSGMNAVATRCRPYLDAWTDEPGRTTIAWPEGWHGGEPGLDAGLDRTQADLGEGDLAALREWHGQHGGIPAHVEFLAKHHPGALKTSQLRIDRLAGTLPPQAQVLMILHLAAFNVWPAIVKRCLLQAQSLGVTRYQALQTILSGTLVGGEWKAEAVLTPVIDLFEAWA